MTIPLNDVQKIERKASKPGNIVNKYVKIQDINNALNECKKEIGEEFKNDIIRKVIFDKLNWWMEITK